MGPCFRRGDDAVGVAPKTGYACAAFSEDIPLDSRQRSIASAFRRVRADARASCDHFACAALVAAAAGPCDGELMIETDGDNLGASHIVSGERSGNAIKVRSLRLQRILDGAGISHIDALKIDVEGYEDRVLTGFFRQAPHALWPRAGVIEQLSRNEWLEDCIADMRARGYAETGTTRSNTLLVN